VHKLLLLRLGSETLPLKFTHAISQLCFDETCREIVRTNLKPLMMNDNDDTS